MSDSPSRNLIVQLGGFGPLAIQPEDSSEGEIRPTRFVLFPDHIPHEKFAAALNWAAASQTPVYCTAADLKRFEQEGFGAYRFNVLGGFREIDFETGSLRFVPARRRTPKGWRAVIRGFANTWTRTRREAFHVIAKAPDEGTVLYLATPFVDKHEWALLRREKPSQIFGSAHYGRVYWTALAERLGVTIDVARTQDDALPSATMKIFGVPHFPHIERPTVSAKASGGVEGDLSWDKFESGSGS